MLPTGAYSRRTALGGHVAAAPPPAHPMSALDDTPYVVALLEEQQDEDTLAFLEAITGMTRAELKGVTPPA